MYTVANIVRALIHSGMCLLLDMCISYCINVTFFVHILHKVIYFVYCAFDTCSCIEIVIIDNFGTNMNFKLLT